MLIKRGIDVDLQCKQCEVANETLGHLFFQCPVGAEIWGQLLQWKGTIRPSWVCPKDCVWMERQCGTNGFHFIIYQMVLTGCIYQVW